jgi:lipid-A-disaccharide synthase
VKKLKRYVDELFSILPFEEEFFSRHGLNVRYVGNPLPDAIDPSGAETVSRAEFLRSNGLPDKPLVALLPGSRAQEIRAMLPVMSRMASEFPEFAFLISGTRASDSDLYRKYSADNSLPVLFDQTYEMLRHAHAALVTSGTATLETALIGTPQIVLYKMAGGRIGYAIFKRLFLRVKYVSLPNLILDREAVREFVMHEMTEEKVRPETELLLKDQAYRNKILESYARLRDRMGEKGVSERTAATIFAKIRRSE